jgi:hypothetical protein
VLDDDIAQALPILRGEAEAAMASSCTITRPGSDVTDPDTGEVTNSGTQVYSGKCRIRPAQAWGRMAIVAGETVTPDTFQVSVPFAVTGIRRGDLVTVDASPDADCIGRKWYVRFTPDMGDNVTARRLLCEEQSP